METGEKAQVRRWRGESNGAEAGQQRQSRQRETQIVRLLCLITQVKHIVFKQLGLNPVFNDLLCLFYPFIYFLLAVVYCMLIITRLYEHLNETESRP